MPKLKATEIAPISPEALADLMDSLWREYPSRDTPHLFVAARREVAAQLAAGARPHELLSAARQYARHVARERTEPKYVKSMHLFFRDEMWRNFSTPTVYGRTREEWARSGQDVLEFDSLYARLSERHRSELGHAT